MGAPLARSEPALRSMRRRGWPARISPAPARRTSSACPAPARAARAPAPAPVCTAPASVAAARALIRTGVALRTSVPKVIGTVTDPAQLPATIILPPMVLLAMLLLLLLGLLFIARRLVLATQQPDMLVLAVKITALLHCGCLFPEPHGRRLLLRRTKPYHRCISAHLGSHDECTQKHLNWSRKIWATKLLQVIQKFIRRCLHFVD